MFAEPSEAVSIDLDTGAPYPCLLETSDEMSYYDRLKPDTRQNVTVRALPKFLEFIKTVPIRRTGMHFCLKKVSNNLLNNGAILDRVFQGLQKSVRVRARVHYGSDMELQYKPRSHGVPIGNIPADADGNIRYNILNEYLAGEWNDPVASASSCKKYKIMGEEDEEFPNASDTNYDGGHGVANGSSSLPNPSMNPTLTDVLLGRGRGLQQHPGNIRFRQVLEEYQAEFNQTPRYTRVDTPKEITRLLIEDGVRFLQRVDRGNGNF